MHNFQYKCLFSSISLYSINWCFFFFNDTATTEIYTLSLHDALPIYMGFDPFDEFVAGIDIDAGITVGGHRSAHLSEATDGWSTAGDSEGVPGCSKRSYNKAAGEKEPEAYPSLHFLLHRTGPYGLRTARIERAPSEVRVLRAMEAMGATFPPLAFRPQLHIQQFDLPMQVTALDLEVFGRAGDVPVVFAEFAGNELLLEGVPGIAKGIVVLGQQRIGRLGADGRLRRRQLGTHLQRH